MATRFAGRFVSNNASNTSKDVVPVWERQWVQPNPTSRIKILKWVKTTKTRSFPETEDARYVYASSTGTADNAAAIVVDPSTSTSGAAAAGVAAAPAIAAQPVGGGATAAADVIMTDSSGQPVTASAGEGEDIMAGGADETQGQHLFDETQAPDMTMAGDADMSVAEGTDSRVDTALPSAQMTPAAEESTSATAGVGMMADAGQVGGAEEGGEEQEEEDEAEVVDDKYTTIRIGGPIPGEEAAMEPEEISAGAEIEATEPTPQVDSELHPPPDGVPPANPLASTDDEPTAVGAPSADEIERDPTEGVDKDPEGDNLGGVEVVGRDDPEVQGLGDEVAAVVHAQPDGVETVKVVED